MAWQTPKTNWGPPDGVRDTDLNRIEGNILELFRAGGAVSDTTVYVNGSSGNDSDDGTAEAPFKTITAALASINKHTNGKNVTLSIAAGTYLDNVMIKGFTGVLNIVTTGGPVTLRLLTVDGCVVNHTGTQMNMQQGMVLKNGAVFAGNAILYVGGGGATGISVQSGSTLVVLQTVTISNTTSIALDVYGHGRAYVATLAGSSNVTGIFASSGGVVCYGSMSLAATTQRVTNTGGKIYTAAQTSIPNY